MPQKTFGGLARLCQVSLGKSQQASINWRKSHSYLKTSRITSREDGILGELWAFRVRTVVKYQLSLAILQRQQQSRVGQAAPAQSSSHSHRLVLNLALGLANSPSAELRSWGGPPLCSARKQKLSQLWPSSQISFFCKTGNVSVSAAYRKQKPDRTGSGGGAEASKAGLCCKLQKVYLAPSSPMQKQQAPKLRKIGMHWIQDYGIDRTTAAITLLPVSWLLHR